MGKGRGRGEGEGVGEGGFSINKNTLKKYVCFWDLVLAPKSIILKSSKLDIKMRNDLGP